MWHGVNRVLGLAGLQGFDVQENLIIVAGMGPGGLTAAIEAAKKGYKVIIIEPCEKFTRGQRVKISDKTLKYLKSLQDPNDEEDKKFFEKKVFSSKEPDQSTVQIKDIQKYLTRKLKKYDTVEIRQGKAYAIKAIDVDEQTVTLQTPTGEEVRYIRHIVSADGAGREVARLLNKSTDDKSYHVKFNTSRFQPRQSALGTMSLKTQKGKELIPKAEGFTPFTMAHFDRLSELGWKENYFPKVNILPNNDNTKFFVIGEIPAAIEQMQEGPDKQKLLDEWGKLMVSIKLDCKVDDLIVDRKKEQTHSLKHKQKATAFDLEIHVADKSCVEMKKGGAFALVGDAYKDAVPYFAHGVDDAIKDGREFCRALRKPKSSTSFQEFFDFLQFNDHQTKQVTQMEKLFGNEDIVEAEKPLYPIENIMFIINDQSKFLHKLAKKPGLFDQQLMNRYIHDHDLNAPAYYQYLKALKEEALKDLDKPKPKPLKRITWSKERLTQRTEQKKTEINKVFKGLEGALTEYMRTSLEKRQAGIYAYGYRGRGFEQ